MATQILSLSLWGSSLVDIHSKDGGSPDYDELLCAVPSCGANEFMGPPISGGRTRRHWPQPPGSRSRWTGAGVQWTFVAHADAPLRRSRALTTRTGAPVRHSGSQNNRHEVSHPPVSCFQGRRTSQSCCAMEIVTRWQCHGLRQGEAQNPFLSRLGGRLSPPLPE